MGKIFEQSYAWSNSRVQCMRECMWKYNLMYNTAWKGWESQAPQEKRRAYMLKQMTNFAMWTGSVVHNIIEEIITTGRATGEWINLEQAQKGGIQALRKGWKQSIDKRWQGRPKGNINLSEHFYQEDIDKDTTDRCKQKVLKSLKAFYEMPLFEVLKGLKNEDWLTLEDFQKFQLDTGEEVTLKIDCGFRYKGKVYLLDWKTGKVSDSVIDQLVTYGIYALKQKWAKKPEDIVIIPVYLAAFAELGEQAAPHLEVTMQHMKRQAGIIRNESPMLKKAFENRDNPDFFPKTDNEYACKKCFMRDMCSGPITEIEDGETPF
ncbi:hypothetical protein LCGC14_0142170 [marine sediment metagenome]|uniref:PD-(D/E)XK endonuclease-like domain-containing protein n=1 Tax=marine sediment metagenome TaxID=412755 RepID=A0A0F9VGL1_9ZZZZ